MNLKSIFLLLHTLIFCFATSIAQSPETFPLYGDQPIPNSKPAENREKTEVNDWKISFITETSEPTLTVFRPAKPGGAAIIICPGGGYSGTATDHEGAQVAKALAEAGITAFVLKYRIPTTATASTNPSPRSRMPSRPSASCGSGPASGMSGQTASASWDFRQVGIWQPPPPRISASSLTQIAGTRRPSAPILWR